MSVVSQNRVMNFHTLIFCQAYPNAPPPPPPPPPPKLGVPPDCLACPPKALRMNSKVSKRGSYYRATKYRKTNIISLGLMNFLSYHLLLVYCPRRHRQMIYKIIPLPYCFVTSSYIKQYIDTISKLSQV